MPQDDPRTRANHSNGTSRRDRNHQEGVRDSTMRSQPQDDPRIRTNRPNETSGRGRSHQEEVHDPTTKKQPHDGPRTGANRSNGPSRRSRDHQEELRDSTTKSQPLSTLRTIIVGVATAECTALLSILAGLTPAPRDVPLARLVTAHPWVTVTIALFLFLAALAAFVMGRRPNFLKSVRLQASGKPQPTSPGHSRALAATTAVATASTLTLILLLSTLLLRPAWCPGDLCMTSPPLPGAHDQNLNVWFSAIQGSTFAIPGSASQYSASRPPPTRGPEGVVAQQLDSQAAGRQYSPYRVQVHVRNLNSDPAGMYIEGVSLRLLAATPVQATPVWAQPAGDANLAVNPYASIYHGESPAASLPALYQPSEGHVSLGAAEQDSLTVSVTSTTQRQIAFRVQVSYRLTREQTVHTVTLDRVFKVVFLTQGSWEPYHLDQLGRFVPS